MPPERSGRPELLPAVHGVCGTSNFELRQGYVKQVEMVLMTTRVVAAAYAERHAGIDRQDAISQQAVGQAAGRSALDAQAVCHKARRGPLRSEAPVREAPRLIGRWRSCFTWSVASAA
jgi:hypothetical protein